MNPTTPDRAAVLLFGAIALDIMYCLQLAKVDDDDAMAALVAVGAILGRVGALADDACAASGGPRLRTAAEWLHDEPCRSAVQALAAQGRAP